MLFRFSALTFNSHRIHYDRAYTCEIEGYRGLVVHGPLTATLLLELAQQHFGDNALRCFDCRAVSAAICGEELHDMLRGLLSPKQALRKAQARADAIIKQALAAVAVPG